MLKKNNLKNVNIILLFQVVLLSLLYACSTAPPVDYSNFQASAPKSILVIPPLNNSNEIKATNSYLSIVTKPIAEMGYYVFPVAMVDQYLKTQGMPTPGEMHQVNIKKYHDVFGADAVLYITIEDWGSKFRVVSSDVSVKSSAKLVDARNGLLLWSGKQFTTNADSSGQGDLLGMVVQAVIKQAVNDISNVARGVAQRGVTQMIVNKKNGLLLGPRAQKIETNQENGD